MSTVVVNARDYMRDPERYTELAMSGDMLDIADDSGRVSMRIVIPGPITDSDLDLLISYAEYLCELYIRTSDGYSK